MSRKKDKVGEDPNDHQNGWLSLSLSPYLEDSCSQSQTTFVKRKCMKVYTCKFCNRKFYNSQALGGHQNAHKRERDVATRYEQNLPNALNYDASNCHTLPMFHAPPPRDGENFTSYVKFKEKEAEYGVPYNEPGERSLDVEFPFGLDHLNPRPFSQEYSDDTKTVDLNLKL